VSSTPRSGFDCFVRLFRSTRIRYTFERRVSGAIANEILFGAAFRAVDSIAGPSRVGDVFRDLFPLQKV
jgi:hypothetical protein